MWLPKALGEALTEPSVVLLFILQLGYDWLPSHNLFFSLYRSPPHRLSRNHRRSGEVGIGHVDLLLPSIWELGNVPALVIPPSIFSIHILVDWALDHPSPVCPCTAAGLLIWLSR